MKCTKKGFTIVEVVLALTIAVVVSIAAISVILMSKSVSKESEQMHSVTGQISSVLECFKASSNNSDFEKALEMAYAKKLNGLGSAKAEYDLYLYFDKAGNLATDATDNSYSDGYAYAVNIKIKCQDASGSFENASFNASAYEYVKDGISEAQSAGKLESYLIYSLAKSYVKTGGAL